MNKTIHYKVNSESDCIKLAKDYYSESSDRSLLADFLEFYDSTDTLICVAGKKSNYGYFIEYV